MEIALIADVHANLPALEAVLEEIAGLEVLSCGDIIGYNPYPNETIEVFRERGIKGVLGNHDWAALTLSLSWFNPAAAQALLWTARALSKENLRYLSTLPEKLHDSRLLLCHGSPRDPIFEYVYPDAPEALLTSFLQERRVLVLGHTHVPFVKRFEEGLILNPGSVGQPRDGNPRASYAILDVESSRVEIKRVSYDVERVADEIVRRGLPTRLATRLYEGV